MKHTLFLIQVFRAKLLHVIAVLSAALVCGFPSSRLALHFSGKHRIYDDIEFLP